MANIDHILLDIDSFSVSHSYECNVEKCKDILPSTKNCLTLLTQNVRSINCNMPKFEVLLHRLDISCDINILTECWLKNTSIVPKLDGYLHYHTKNNILQNDGVVVYVKEDLVVTVEEPELQDANCLVIKIGQEHAIIAIYRSPANSNINNFIKSLDKILIMLSTYKNITIAGDINIDINPQKLETPGETYLNLTAYHGLLPAHTYVTRDLTGTCIDHILLKSKLKSSTLVLQSTVTDHKSVFLCIEYRPKRYSLTTNHSKIDKTSLQTQLMQIDLEPIYKELDPDISMTYLCDGIQAAILKSTSIMKKPRRQQIIKPWITAGLLKCIKNRDRLHKKHKRSPNNETFKITYKRYRNFCNTLLKNLKRCYERDQINQAGNNSKKLWKAIKDITNTSRVKKLPQELLIDNVPPQQTINNINEYYVNVGRKLAEHIENASHTYDSQPPKSSNLKSLVLLPVDEAEISALITGLKNESSTGIDNISNKLLKEFKHLLISPLSHIFNLCIQLGIFPSILKKSVVSPIYKSGDRDRIQNYRPISILPSISKLLEKALNTRLINFLENQNLLSQNQFGFRKGKSTDDAVLELTNYISSNLDTKKKVITIFLDLAKAFDTVSIPRLLNKLDQIGVRGNEFKIFESYLSNRSQRAKLGPYMSEELPLTYGVPQGSILGPSLFLIYINELLQLNSFDGKITAYADDTALTFVGRTWQDAYNKAQMGFNIVKKWLHDNVLTLNIDKSKFIAFSIRNLSSTNTTHTITAHDCNSPHFLTCHCPKLEKVSSIKYLGVIIDKNLNFSEHINIISNRVRKLIFIFKNLRHILDPIRLKQVYLALCQSIITYCIASWGGASKSTIEKLEIAQRAVLKVSTFKPFLFPTTELYKFCEVLTVRQLFLLSLIVRQHSSTIFDSSLSEKRRHYMVCQRDRLFHTAFSHKFFPFLGPHIYNKINKILVVYHGTKSNCKLKVAKWLQQLTYDETEKFMEV